MASKDKDFKKKTKDDLKLLGRANKLGFHSINIPFSQALAQSFGTKIRLYFGNHMLLAIWGLGPTRIGQLGLILSI